MQQLNKLCKQYNIVKYNNKHNNKIYKNNNKYKPHNNKKYRKNNENKENKMIQIILMTHNKVHLLVMIFMMTHMIVVSNLKSLKKFKLPQIKLKNSKVFLKILTIQTNKTK